jgi:hypothetical protein
MSNLFHHQIKKLQRDVQREVTCSADIQFRGDILTWKYTSHAGIRASAIIARAVDDVLGNERID